MLATLSPGSTKGVAIEDDLGNLYPLQQGAISTPARWDDPRMSRAQMAFIGKLPAEAQAVTLRLQTYEALIVGDWTVQVDFPPGP